MNTVIQYCLFKACILLVLLAGYAHADSRVTYYHNDIFGNPIAATDEEGKVIWRQDYAPYGAKRTNDMEAVVEKAGFTGHRHDIDTDLIYAKARMYDPRLGRFLNIDPVGA